MARARFGFLLLVLASAGGCAPAMETGTMTSLAPKPLMVWEDLLSRPKPAPDVTISYGPDALQVVDVWQPNAAKFGRGPHPAVVMIHGGCWQTAIAERDIMNWIADDLRAHGVGVWNIEYRGVDRGGGYPGTYLDVGAAADLFATKRAEYGFRTDAPVVTIGHSAGGHLSLWLARRSALAKGDALRGAKPLRVDLAISQGGLPDLRAQMTLPDHGCGNESATAMAKGEFSRTSPPEMPKGRARELQFNNDLDSIAPPSFGAAYGARMVTTPHEGHAELIAPETVSWGKQRAEILKAFGLKAAKP
ncbi:alpha/beta hydrolase [Sphingorhabdus sp.]|uniref:alpha/beta hydrolase n=1 Tax=Sphingorhabdus sp. TaxID=1902408 RepID=UPI0039836F51